MLTGCATWSKHRILPEDNGRFRIAVVPIRSELKIKRLKYIQTLPKDFVHSQDEETLVENQFENIKREMTLSLHDKLNRTEEFEIVPDTEVQKAILELNISSGSLRLTEDELERLGKRLNVPAVLNVAIGGYGKVKRKWLFYIFGSGGVEAISQGLAAATITTNPWLITAVVGEEVLQETTVWGGGIYFFNRIFTPVILDARMVGTFDKKIIWKDISIAIINFKALKKLSKEKRGKKEVRLWLVSEKALQKLTMDLEATAKRNLKHWKKQ